MNGFEVMSQLRRLSSLVSVPILAVTANSVDKDRDYYVNAGFDGCLFKPIDAGQIVHIVREYIARAEIKTAPSIIPEITLRSPENVV